MADLEENRNGKETGQNIDDKPLTGEEVVITGISGLFPSSNNVVEFMDNLYNKVDMVTCDNMNFDHPEMPKYIGRINETTKFDTQFFRVTHNMAIPLDPMCRKLLEQTYSAMYDAGINPLTYKGKKIGVFNASSYMDSTNINLFNILKESKFIMTGASKAMFANRISYFLDGKGPSYSVDCACSSVMVCLQNAYISIKSGVCEAAIVNGSQCILHPNLSLNLKRYGALCLDGKTKCFDKDADGYVRSETIGALFLQKAKDAKRIYAEVCHATAAFNLSPDEEFLSMRKPETIIEFLKDFYLEAGVSPNDVEYVEAHGTAIPESDANELEAIGRIFGNKNPIMVGCVKSNMGDSEPASGICGLTKLCIAYHKGELPANIHYKKPLDIPVIRERTVKVLTDNTPFRRGYTAINNFSFTGYNCHVLLNGHFKPKDLERYKSNLPRLVLVSGRQENGIMKLFNILKSKPIDPELIGMLHNIYQIDTPGHTCRGYTILDTDDKKRTISLAQSTELYQGEKPPVWLVYSGMGSQWAGMGTELMRIPIFAAAIERCDKILKPKGIDIVHIITHPDSTIQENIINCFVGISAIQIGLTDVLNEIGLIPDNVIGHSLGELACAYADGCFTTEEMILSSYARGLVSVNTKFIKGYMAAVGLGYEEVLPICPPEIDIACHNSGDSCTISGPAEIVSKFVCELKDQGIFAKEVPTGNIAFHSRYVQNAGPKLLKEMKRIIKNPKERTNKWICSSLPEEKWDEPLAKYASSEYFVNNIVNSVLFEEAARHIPSDAVVIEVAPHSLLQAILKRSHPECNHIALSRRGHSNGVQLLLEAIGKLYEQGFNLKADVLYPKIEFPVSTETSILSHLVDWYHEEDWPVKLCGTKTKIVAPIRDVTISLIDDEYRYIAGNFREGHIVFPEAALLIHVWETLAMYKEKGNNKMSVAFHDIQFYGDVIINPTKAITLSLEIRKGDGYFQVTDSETLVAIASGYVAEINNTKSDSSSKVVATEDDSVQLDAKDIYSIMSSRGYSYRDEFQSIYSASLKYNTAQVKWMNNWITFLDSLFQLNVLTRDHDGISVPLAIKKLTIDIDGHNKAEVATVENIKTVKAHFQKENVITCGGLIIEEIIFTDKPLPEEELDDFESKLVDTIYYNQSDNTYKSFKLICSTPGDLDSLKWVEKFYERSGQNYIKVHFAGPSLRDAQKAVGLENEIDCFGMDFSGIDQNGNRVMGLVAAGALASIINPDLDLLWPVPSYWDLAEAATVPLPYVQVYYCLTIKEKLRSYQSIFVTDGSSALGQAVISICLSLGCTVFTCVSDIHKKRFLIELFPQLNEYNIGFSRDISFFYMVVNNSQNKRCDFVINTYSGTLREFSMKCVGFCGIFLDISNYDMKRNKCIEMDCFSWDRTYNAVNVSNIFKPENIKEKKILQNIICSGIAKGIVKPINHVVFPIDDIPRAFRFLTSINQTGTVLIDINSPSSAKNTSDIIPRLSFSAKGVYVIVGDNTDNAIKLANRIVQLGAKNIILNMKSKTITGYLQYRIARWHKLGVTINITTNDLQKENECVEFLKTESGPAQIRGIFIIQPVLKTRTQDDIINNMNKFVTVVANLDLVSRNNCPELRYFTIIERGHLDVTDEFCTKTLHKIYHARNEIGLPEHLLKDSFLTERSLRENSANLNTHGVKISQSIDFFNEVSKVIGVNITNEFKENLTVSDLISNDIVMEELKFIIKKTLDLDLPTDFIQNMTITRLKNLCDKQLTRNSKLKHGLSTFYTFIDRDEVSANEFIVPMPSLFDNFTENKEDLDGNKTYLMLIPGFEGHHHIFKPICKGLKIGTVTFQLGPDLPSDSIQEMAYRIKKFMNARFMMRSKFYLLGYSFGVNIALEIAALLEKDGITGVVYCLDSSPDALRVQLDTYFGQLSEAQVQDTVIEHLFYVMSGEKSETLRKEIKEENTWCEKVNACINVLKNLVTYSIEYQRAILEAAYSRILLAQSYKPELKLESELVLIKEMAHPGAKSLPDDYSLSKYTNKPVKVYDVSSKVASVFEDYRVPNIVNQILDPELLEEFKNKNVCFTYLSAPGRTLASTT